MASDDSTRDGLPPTKPGRVPPTLDLKAEDVTEKETSPTPAEAIPDTPPEAAHGTEGTEPAGETPPAEPTAVTEDAPPSEAAAPNPPPAGAERPARTAFPALIAVLAGGIAGAAVAAGIGLFAGREQAADLGPLTARIAALEARPATDPKALAALGQRIERAEAGLKSADAALAALKASPAAGAPPAADLEPFTAGLTAARQALASTQSELAALKRSQQDLAATVKALPAATVSVQQIQSLSTRIDELHKSVTEELEQDAARERAAAAIAVLAELKEAVRAGRPFAAELDAARAILGPSAGSFDAFGAAAAEGYAPPGKLAQRLSEAGTSALAAKDPAPTEAASGSLVDRLVASAGNLVRISPADQPPATVRTTLEIAIAAVRTGDFDAAAQALERLPPPVQERLKELIEEIVARQNAVNVAATLYQQALAAVSGKMP